jgi:hypothetical protein
METRGFGRTTAEPSLLARVAVVAGAIGVCAGGGLAIFGRTSGAVIAAIGMAGLVGGAHSIGALHRRTRYRPERLTSWDAAMIGCACVTIAVAVIARATGAGGWYAYPVIAWPAVSATAVVAALMTGAPIVLLAVRRARLVRASERQPEMAGARL